MVGALEERVFEGSFRTHIGRYPVREKVIHIIFHQKEIENPCRKNRQKGSHQDGDNGGKTGVIL